MRSDKGAETLLMAESHVQLRQAASGKSDYPIQKMYIYGPSTSNVRIERWWGLLATGYTAQWRSFFENLENDGYFDGSWVDKTALQYLFMPTIRKGIAGYVEAHNNHPIRKQRNVVIPTGKPDILYHHPLDRDYGREPDRILLQNLLSKVDAWSPTEYITTVTQSFCNSVLTTAGIPVPWTFVSGDESCIATYIMLRQKLWSHVNSGNLPLLTKISLPYGGKEWMKNNDKIEQLRQQKKPKEGRHNNEEVLEETNWMEKLHEVVDEDALEEVQKEIRHANRESPAGNDSDDDSNDENYLVVEDLVEALLFASNK